MAISSENTYLIYDGGGDAAAWSKLIDIKEFPDMGSAPSTIDTTTLSQHMKTSIPGLVDPGALEFSANYTKADYTAVKALEGAVHKFGIQFGKTGEDGVFTFEGKLSCWVKGAGVEEAVDMGISIAPSTEIELDATAKATIE